jgi:hypothetical protein
MDVSDASYYISIEKKKNKGSQMGHTKKILIKNNKTCLGRFQDCGRGKGKNM